MATQNSIKNVIIALLLSFSLSLTFGLEVGVDVSEVKAAEDRGVQYKDTSGQIKPALQIFKDHGYNWVRIRIMVTTDGRYGLFQNLDYVKAMARDAKSRGFKFLLDFHYSHWWADPGNQWTPDIWKNTNISQLSTLVYNYTLNVINALRNQGTMPDMVQIGNEVNAGMLWELGKNTNWTNFISLTNSGANAVEDAKGSLPMPKIMMHIANAGDKAGTQWWVDNFISKGGWINVLGLSYYPMWHGSLDAMKSNVLNIKTKYPWLEVYIVETGYFWAQTGVSTGLSYPQTQQGQYDYLKAFRQKAIEAKCTGVFYWGAGWAQTYKWLDAPGWNGDTARRALFDDNALATKGIDGLF